MSKGRTFEFGFDEQHDDLTEIPQQACPACDSPLQASGSRRCVSSANWLWPRNGVFEQMATADTTPVSFDETDTRRDEMHSTIDAWLNDLVDAIGEAQTSEQFQRWLDVQAAFHDYSYRNTLLIERQCPEATKVAGYRTWQDEFDRYVTEGEQAIWIWAPIITERCPRCENSESYHAQSDCEYDETPPEAWDRGLVGYQARPRLRHLADSW